MNRRPVEYNTRSKVSAKKKSGNGLSVDFSKLNDESKDVQGNRYRRRSRLGTRRLSTNTFKINLNPFQNEVVSVKKSTQPGFEDDGGIIKKRLFTEVCTSRRLNMDSCSFNSSEGDTSSNKNLDHDVTGIGFLNDPQSNQSVGNSKRCGISGSNLSSDLLKLSSKPVLQSKSPGLKFFPTNSDKSQSVFTFSKLNNVTNNMPSPPSFKHGDQFSRDGALQTPTPPPISISKRKLERFQRIRTPELPKFNLMHHYEHNFDTNLQRDTDNKSYVDKSLKSTSVKENDVNVNASISKSSCVNNERFGTEEYKSQSNSGADYIDTVIKSSETFTSCSNTRFIKNEDSFNYDLNDSLKTSFIHSKTYTVNDGECIKLNSVIKRSSFDDNNALSKTPVISSKTSTTHTERSPSFFSFAPDIKSFSNCDDSTETFMVSESWINKTVVANDDTLIANDRTLRNSSTKKKLSVIAEEITQSTLSTSRVGINQISIKGFDDTFNCPQKITSTEKTNAPKSSSALRITLNKMCDVMKTLENLKYETDLFMQNQNRNFAIACNVMCELKDEIVDLAENKENNLEDSQNCNLVEQMSAVMSRFKNSMEITNGFPKTPEHYTSSRSLYTQLKSDYMFLKTPKQTTVKKSAASTMKILTPHSMSMCIQDQVDQLFNE